MKLRKAAVVTLEREIRARFGPGGERDAWLEWLRACEQGEMLPPPSVRARRLGNPRALHPAGCSKGEPRKTRLH